MIGYTAKQIQLAEQPQLAAGEPLMERAAAALAGCAQELLARKPGLVLVLAGAGNNGGDGLFAAAELSRAGEQVAIMPVMGTLHEAGAFAARTAGAEFLFPPGATEEEIDAALRILSPAVVIDAMLGTGSAGRAALFGGPLTAVKALLEKRNAGEDFLVLAADVPSGLDADSGTVPGEAILAADLTATFGAAKAGLLLSEGPAVSGEIRVIEIGIEGELEKMQPAVGR